MFCFSSHDATIFLSCLQQSPIFVRSHSIRFHFSSGCTRMKFNVYIKAPDLSGVNRHNRTTKMGGRDEHERIQSVTHIIRWDAQSTSLFNAFNIFGWNARTVRVYFMQWVKMYNIIRFRIILFPYLLSHERKETFLFSISNNNKENNQNRTSSKINWNITKAPNPTNRSIASHPRVNRWMWNTLFTNWRMKEWMNHLCITHIAGSILGFFSLLITF